jgi:hypothetical protein
MTNSASVAPAIRSTAGTWQECVSRTRCDVGTLLAVGAITVCVAGAAFLPSWQIAKAVVAKPSKKPRQRVWKCACFLTALWPIGLLLLVVSLLDLAVTHKVFGSNAGENVTFALLIAVVGTFAYAQFDFFTAQNGRTIAWSLGKALSDAGEKRKQFRVDEDLIKGGSGRDRRQAISRVLNAKVKARPAHPEKAPGGAPLPPDQSE